jgi:hypothetical protein
MSSSSRLERPYLPDLHQELPAPTPQEFIETFQFDQVVRPELPPISPEEAHRNGLAEGEELGRGAALKEMQPILEHFRSLTGSVAQLQQRFLADAEVELVRVATEIARRVVRGELQQENDTVVRMARICIQEAQPSDSATLYCAEADLELLRVHLADLESELAEQSLTLRADGSIEPGGVVLEVGAQFYDGRPERLLRAATAELNAEGGS